MSSRPDRAARRRGGCPAHRRRRGASALCAASIALLLLATLPAASALASTAGTDPSSTGTRGGPDSVSARGGTDSPGTHGNRRTATAATPAVVRPLTAPGELLAPGQLEALLAKLPLSDLSAAQLAHYLTGLEDISALASLHVGLLGTEELGAAGLEESLRKAIEALGPTATIGELANTSTLLPAVEAKLDTLLAALLGSDLGLEQQHDLSTALSTLDLNQLTASLLASAQEPAQLNALCELAGKLFAELGGAGVEGLLGAPLSGGFAPTTVKNVAQELGTTPAVVSDELGQTAAQLPATATLLTAPVTGGKLLAVAPAVKGLALGLLGASPEEGAGKGSGESGSEGKGGSGAGSGEGKEGGGSGNEAGGSGDEGGGSEDGSGEGGSGSGEGGSGLGGAGGAPGAPGAGGQGSDGGTAGLTLVVNVPSGQTVPATAGASKKVASPKIAILDSKTRGAVATILLQTPAAGRLTLRGPGLTTSSRTLARAARVTLTIRLSKASAARLRRHRHPLKVALRASFKTAAGASSSTTTTLSFG